MQGFGYGYETIDRGNVARVDLDLGCGTTSFVNLALDGADCGGGGVGVRWEGRNGGSVRCALRCYYDCGEGLAVPAIPEPMEKNTCVSLLC